MGEADGADHLVGMKVTLALRAIPRGFGRRLRDRHRFADRDPDGEPCGPRQGVGFPQGPPSARGRWLSASSKTVPWSRRSSTVPTRRRMRRKVSGSATWWRRSTVAPYRRWWRSGSLITPHRILNPDCGPSLCNRRGPPRGPGRGAGSGAATPARSRGGGDPPHGPAAVNPTVRLHPLLG